MSHEFKLGDRVFFYIGRNSDSHQRKVYGTVVEFLLRSTTVRIRTDFGDPEYRNVDVKKVFPDDGRQWL